MSDKPLEITVVPDMPCPHCGAAWGHPDKALDFANRPKVGDEFGVWWWRCYNPACPVSYYDPETGVVEREDGEDMYERDSLGNVSAPHWHTPTEESDICRLCNEAADGERHLACDHRPVDTGDPYSSKTPVCEYCGVELQYDGDGSEHGPWSAS